MDKKNPSITTFWAQCVWLLFALLFFAQGALGQTLRSDPDLTPQVQGSVFAIARQADGKMLIGGSFNYVNGIARNNLARLNPDGSVDAAWNPNVDSNVQAISLDASGRVYVGGGFLAVGGQTRYGLARVDGVTGLADDWHPSTGGTVYSLALDETKGKLYAGGQFFYADNQVSQIQNLVRIDTTTALADPWDAQIGGTVNALALDGAGSLYVASQFTTTDWQTLAKVSKFDLVSSVAKWSVSTTSYGVIHSLLLDGSTSLYVGGYFNDLGLQSRAGLARLSTGTGLVNVDWNPGTDGQINAMLLDGAGSLYVAGNFLNVDAGNAVSFTR